MPRGFGFVSGADLRARISLWVWILSIIGYPVVGLTSTALNWEGASASIPFRACVLGLSLLVLLTTNRLVPNLRGCQWLLVFWVIYTFRLAWDAVAVGRPGAGEAMFMFLFLSVFPALAVGVGGGNRISERDAAWRLGLLGSLACLLALLMQAFGWGIDQTLDSKWSEGRLAFVSVNPITLGHAGCTVLICVMCLAGYRSNVVEKIFIVSMAILGCACLMAAGSRGPLVSLVICVLLVFLRARRPVFSLVAGALLVAAMIYEGANLLERIGNAAGEDKSSQERLLLLANAIQQFVENPLFGGAYVEPISGEYPHNIFVESAMAMGIPGLLLMAAIIAVAFRSAWVQLSVGRILVPLVCVQYMVAAQFSGSLWGAAALWVTLVMTARVHRTSGYERDASLERLKMSTTARFEA